MCQCSTGLVQAYNRITMPALGQSFLVKIGTMVLAVDGISCLPHARAVFVEFLLGRGWGRILTSVTGCGANRNADWNLF